MKKRHIIPTGATYTTFMSAYAQAKPEILTSTQLERAQGLYKEWANLALSARTDNAIAAITSVHPAAAYISVLANAKLYQTIWDTFYDLNVDGPLAPNQFVFTSMFIAFAKRATIPSDTTTFKDTTSGDAPSGETVEAAPSLSDIRVKNAQDARLLWRMVLRTLERRPFPVDSHLVVAALRALQHGELSELELALKIVDEYLGLRAPDAPVPSEPIKPLELNVRLLDSALSVCNAAKRPDLTRHFLDILTTPGHPQRTIVSTGAMNLLIEAYASLGDSRQIIKTIDWMIREGALPGGLEVIPGNSSWCIALRACLVAQDWDAAKTLTKRLASTTNSKRMIDAETIYLVLKVTYALKPTNERLYERQLRQALDAVYYVVSVWPKDSNATQELYAKLNPKRVERRFVFQNALGDLVKKILNEFDGLRSIPGFDDLTYRLNQLRTNIPDKISARYKQDL
ncbi:PPR domain protein [Rhizoctonia solani AG-3 Rhs1AP]|nr:PPR domain protein [Rhizoctonia solani AG-3 Rhs1AP]